MYDTIQDNKCETKYDTQCDIKYETQYEQVSLRPSQTQLCLDMYYNTTCLAIPGLSHGVPH